MRVFRVKYWRNNCMHELILEHCYDWYNVIPEAQNNGIQGYEIVSVDVINRPEIQTETP